VTQAKRRAATAPPLAFRRLTAILVPLSEDAIALDLGKSYRQFNPFTIDRDLVIFPEPTSRIEIG